MINRYRTSCSSCHAFFEVEYGSKDKDKITVFAIYSCPTCKNLFSLPNVAKELLCPTCGNKNLKQYIMNKEKNMRYYKKMLQEGLLTTEKYDTLARYWKNIESTVCPKCGKDTLTWRCYEKKK